VRLVVMRERTGQDVTLKQVREMFGIPVHWTMPSDYSTVITAMNSGEPLVTALPRSKIAKSLRQLSQQFADHQSTEPSEKRLPLLMRLGWHFGRVSQGIK
jgi:Flp pilus assembly CpaE family ATPase